MQLLSAHLTDGVWRSTDKGNSWEHLGLDEEINFNPVTGVAINSAGNIYASSYRLNYLFYKTTDQGSTWQNVDNNILNTHTKRGQNIVVDRLGNVFAFTDFNEIYYSKDNGSSWTLIDDSWDHSSNIAKLDAERSLVAYSFNHGLFTKDFFTEEVKTFGLPKYWGYNDIAFHPLKDSVIYVSVSGPQDERSL
ncbi:MAG: hypothetical protein U5K00_07135 [Melioribacteraceae bacterium]|nr:hypothetical protein [Melioribacteraceae bacterium]